MVTKLLNRLVKSKSQEQINCEIYYKSVFKSTDILVNEYFSSYEELKYLERDWSSEFESENLKPPKTLKASCKLIKKSSKTDKKSIKKRYQKEDTAVSAVPRPNTPADLQNHLKQNFSVKTILSSNNKCVVYTAKCKKSSQKVVIKNFITSAISQNEIAMTKLAHEICPEYTLPPVLLSLSSKAVKDTNQGSSQTTPSQHCLVQPKFGESLFDFMANKKRTLTAHECKTIYKQVAIALTKLQAGLYHLDIKEENILIDPYSYKIKLIDFGISRTTPIKKGKIAGSLDFIAPEIFLSCSNENSLPKHDVWSFGCALFSSLTGKLPYSSMGKLLSGEEKINFSLVDEVLKQNLSTSIAMGQDKKKAIANLKLELKLLFEKVFVVDYDKRCSMAEVLTFKFFE